MSPESENRGDEVPTVFTLLQPLGSFNVSAARELRSVFYTERWDQTEGSAAHRVEATEKSTLTRSETM